MSIFIIYGNQLPPKKAKKKRNQIKLSVIALGQPIYPAFN